MSRNYKFHDPEGVYFVSFATVGFAGVFTKNRYREIIIKSLKYCQRNKGMEIYAWVIMSNHLHFVYRSKDKIPPGQILGDFKRFTSKQIVKSIMENPNEQRKYWLLDLFREAGKNVSNVNYYQFWRHDNMPIQLCSNKMIDQKINYIHNNPVKARIVHRPEDYIYSSAGDYYGEKGLLDITIIR